MLSLAVLILGLGAQTRSPVRAGAFKSDNPGAFSELKSLEYHLRWDHDEFSAHYAWHLIPPAKAELPPQYQKAFSLKVWPNHRLKTLKVEYHEQMVTDDSTHRSGKATLKTDSYETLAKLLSEPIACKNTVDPGWVGPSPEYLHLDYKSSRLSLFASLRSEGPAGPGRELSGNAQRRYLCNKDLMQWLQARRRDVLK